MSDAALDLEPHLPSLKQYARSLTHDWSRADDLVQDTVVRALAKAHLFCHDTSLRGWRVTIMHNEHVNSTRRYFRGPVTVSEETLGRLGRDETQTTPVELYEVRRAIDRLLFGSAAGAAPALCPGAEIRRRRHEAGLAYRNSPVADFAGSYKLARDDCRTRLGAWAR
jgi:hypothetical protein